MRDVMLIQAAGYCGEWTAIIAWYIAFAELLNECWFRGRVSFCFFDRHQRHCLVFTCLAVVYGIICRQPVVELRGALALRLFRTLLGPPNAFWLCGSMCLSVMCVSVTASVCHMVCLSAIHHVWALTMQAHNVKHVPMTGACLNCGLPSVQIVIPLGAMTWP